MSKEKQIKKVAVIGAGTMGSGIAAQIANAEIEVVLLDKYEGFADKQVLRMQKAKPADIFNAGFMSPDNARFITTGTTDDNLDMIADCDWVIETILAPHEIRQQLYKDMEKIAKPDAIFSSNTSTMQTDYMTNGLSDSFKKRFLNTHFFNPVRFMHLLEIIPSEHTDPEIVKAITKFGDKTLGKKSVICKDERGFIANRIGVYGMERAQVEALKQGVSIEDADALMGNAFEFSHLGFFKLADEVGLDVIHHVRNDLNENLPETDEFNQIFTGNEELETMMEDGYVGNRKADSKGGYYRLKKNEETGKPMRDEKGKVLKEARDLVTGEYHDFKKSPYFKFEEQIKTMGGMQKFFDSAHEGNKFAWPVVRDLMIYTLDHAEELAYDLQAIDDAMRSGFNWLSGPFEIMDKMGADWFAKRLETENIAVPALLEKARTDSFYREVDGQLEVMDFEGDYAPVQRAEGVIKLEDFKRKSEPLVTDKSASLWNIGDGVTCLEFHSTMNAIDPSTIHVINESVKFMNKNKGDYKAMVIYNDDPKAFSAGANLHLINGILKTKAGIFENLKMSLLEDFVYYGQAATSALRFSDFPVIASPHGYTFGGGAEMLLAADAAQSGPEVYAGLVEAGVGLLPAWGGSTTTLRRAYTEAGRPGGSVEPLKKAFNTIALPIFFISSSAENAKEKGWLQESDGITMNPDRLLFDSKQRALEMVEGYTPPKPAMLPLMGSDGKALLEIGIDDMVKKGGLLTTHDVTLSDAQIDVLTGGKNADITKPVSEFDVLDQELAQFTSMMKTSGTKARVDHQVKTNKTLREKEMATPEMVTDLRAARPEPIFRNRKRDGQPLTGLDSLKLKFMAILTKKAFDKVDGYQDYKAQKKVALHMK